MNTLALIDAILKQARKDGTMDRVNNYLVALAEKAGVPEDTIVSAAQSDDYLVIYAP